MKNQKSLQIIPDTIIFHDLEIGETDTMDIWAKNISKKPMKIRFSFPYNSPFSVDQTKTNVTPPGLEVKSTVHFTCSKLEIEKSILKVECDDCFVEIPAISYPPAATFKLSSTSFDLGTIAINTTENRKFKIENVGTIAANFKLACNSDTIKFPKSTGTISPQQNVELGFSFRSKRPGKIEHKINFTTDQTETPIILNVKANVVDYSLVLLYEGKEITDFNFGHVYFGQKKVVQIEVVNKCPCKRSFIINPPHDPKSNTSKFGSSRTQSSAYDLDSIFTAVPCEGLLPPYEKTAVSLIFKPHKSVDSTDDIEYIFNRLSTVEVVETGQVMEFQLEGFGIIPNIKLSMVDFFFDYKKVKTRSSQTLTIYNNSEYLPVTFEISQVAHFRFKPLNGKIDKKSSKNITITFFPKNMGDFEEASYLSFCNGLLRKHINLVGSCLQSSDQPKEFIRTEIYDTDENAHFNALHPDTRFGLSMQEINRNTTLRKQFDGYITDSAQKREEVFKKNEIKKRATQDIQNYLRRTGILPEDVDMSHLIQEEIKKKTDHEFQSGSQSESLKPPHLKRLHIDDNLKIPSPEKFGLISRFPTTKSPHKKVNMGDKVMVKTKFKPYPTTPPEINECSRSLSPTQQIQISSSHQSISFGQVSVFYAESRSFTVTNGLDQYIFVEFFFDCEELKKSSPYSQVVPPLQTAGFDITFLSKEAQNFTKVVNYKVNKVHEYVLNISAQAIPIDLKFSKSTIEFSFPFDSIEPFVKEYLTIQNTSSSAAEISWSGFNNEENSKDKKADDEVFFVTNSKGRIEPKGSYTAEFTFRPTVKPHYEKYVTLNVVGGPPKKVRLIGDAGKPRLTVNKRNVQFGLMPVGVEKTQKIRLKNSGPDDGIFSITTNGPKSLIISPFNGRIGSSDYKSISFTIKCDKPETFTYGAQIEVCGGNPVNITLTGQAEFPKVELIHDELEFGRNFIGSFSSKDLVIKNIGQIPACLYLDLSEFKAFHIEFNSELSNVTPAQKVNSIIQVNELPDLSTSSKISSSTSNENTISSIKDASLDKSNIIYKITVIEQSEIPFSLVFQPTETGDYSFELPLTLASSSATLPPLDIELQPMVTAEAIRSPLLTSTPLIHFGLAPVFTTDNPNGRPVVKELTLINNYRTEIKYRLENDSNAFIVDKPKGVIDYSSTATIFLSFKPNRAQPFNYFLPIYSETDEGEMLITKIQLTGIGTSRQFWTSTNYVCLPIVPLNVKVEQTIDLINAAFIDTDITIHTALNEKSFPLSVTFPEGNQLRHQEASKPILVSFESAKPLSFSTIIALTAGTGDSYSFTVSATADNSVFTLYPFLSLNKYQIHGGSHKPITITTDTSSFNSEFLASFLSATDYVEIENLKGNITPMMNEFIRKILNSLLLTSPISLYPNDIINSEGHLLYNIINNLCGSKKPNLKRSSDLYEFFDGIIKFLISCGAELAEIKPEFLLPKEKFLQFMKTKIINRLLGIDYYNAPDKSVFNQKLLNEFTSTQNFMSALMPQINALDNLYPTLSTEAYSFVLMQMIKIFMISKLNVEKFSSIPGVASILKELKENLNDSAYNQINRSAKNLMSSNIFSQIESSLLKWLCVHYNHINYAKPVFINDFSQMADPEFYKVLIKSHLPKEKIEDKVSAFLKALKMNFFPSEEEICSDNMVMQCFNCYQLFQTLPRYVATTTVEFKTELNKPIVLTVSVTNTSKTEILYTASLEGSSNFTFDNDSLLLAPSKTAEFPISYNANTHFVENCKLTLTPGRPRPATRPMTVTLSPAQTTTARSGFSSAMSTTRNKNSKNSSLVKPLTIVPNRNMILNSGRSTQSRNTFMTGRSEAADSMIDGITPRKEQPAPLFAAPIVVNLVSNVQINAPLKSIKMEGRLYEQTSAVIEVESPIPGKATFKVISKYFRYLDEYNRTIGEKVNPSQQIIDFLNDPNPEIEEDESLNQFDQLIRDHQPFIFSHNEIKLPLTDSDESSVNNDQSNKDDKTFKVEFNPISLGTYRCLILFLNDKKGEFVYEIIAKANLPSPFVLNSPTIKTEAKSSTTVNIPLDVLNPNLPKTIAYSTEKRATVENCFNERKFKELHAFRTREVQTIFNQCFTSNKFKASVSSAQYFSVPNEFTILMSSLTENSTKDKSNMIPLTFAPTNPGDYANKIVMISLYDVRVYAVVGIGLATTNYLDISLETVAGREIVQEVPIPNPSNDLWNYKVSISGLPDAKYFTVKSRFSVDPNSVFQLPFSFTANTSGEYHADMTVTNSTKEAVVVYKLTVKVSEPLAEQKVIINCRAREKYTQKLDLPPFAKTGVVMVSSTVPILECPQAIQFQNRKPKAPFEFSIFALRNGITAGTLTFTEVSTQLYCWFVIECHIESPLPEETIYVQTEARKTATIDISLSNPKDTDVVFDVEFNESDFFGPKTFKIAAKSKSIYKLVFSPLKEQKRISSVSFFNDTEGEFIYLLDLNVGPAEVAVLSPLECPIGKSATASIMLENPLPTETSFTCENDNSEIFEVKTKKNFVMNPRETRQIDIVFTPGSVGNKELATVVFKSADVGDYTFKMSGLGKPPIPLSPIIIEASINLTNSGIINFSNPFRQPTKFTISLNSDIPDVFSFLTKKRSFILNEFGQTTTVPFSFSPKHSGQFKANIIIAQDKAQWLFPIIGNATITENKDIPIIFGQSGEVISQKLKFPIVGEREEFQGTDYNIIILYPEGYDFLSKVMELQFLDFDNEDGIPTIIANFKFSPRRPLNINIKVSVENPLHQRWEFTYNLDISSSNPIESISLECILNKEVHHTIELKEIFNERVSYRAYFAPGSATEFSVTKSQGYIEQSLKEVALMPFDVVFKPTMYGKVMKGLLVIDTLESQYLFEYIGLIPDYIPPNITWGGRIDNKTPDSILKWKEICTARKKNFIKENIDSARITRPKSALTNHFKH